MKTEISMQNKLKSISQTFKLLACSILDIVFLLENYSIWSNSSNLGRMLNLLERLVLFAESSLTLMLKFILSDSDNIILQSSTDSLCDYCERLSFLPNKDDMHCPFFISILLSIATITKNMRIYFYFSLFLLLASICDWIAKESKKINSKIISYIQVKVQNFSSIVTKLCEMFSFPSNNRLMKLSVSKRKIPDDNDSDYSEDYNSEEDSSSNESDTEINYTSLQSSAYKKLYNSNDTLKIIILKIVELVLINSCSIFMLEFKTWKYQNIS